MKKALRVLIVEDSENDALLLLRRLRHDGFDPEFDRVDSPQAMAAALKNHRWDIVISDYSLPRFSGLQALAVLKQTGLDIPFILVSGTIGEEIAVEAMKAGANDYVMKGKLQRLTTAIERELREVEVRKERKQAQDWQRYLAQYDVLTDLPNRNLLYERLAESIDAHRGNGQSLALMLMDLNDFKEINNTMGHQTGDVLLQEVGRRLQGTIQKNETVARLGGDEFAILCPGMTKDRAIASAEKLLRALEPPFPIGDLAVDVRASIGIAIFPEHGEDRDTLFRHADVAMYQAKRSAVGYVTYSQERDPYSPKRLALIAELHRTIQKKELFLVYQPKVNLASGSITGVESLARWKHPRFGFIPPDQFIPWAERTGFIRPLTSWALETALAQSDAWLRQGLRVPVGVNISTRILHDGDLPNRLERLLKEMAVDPEQLELEITESVIMEDPEHALQVLTQINRMRVALAIDDFGTGYSSLAYLKKLPVHAVKIDKSFVMQMTRYQNDAQIVRSTIDLAHNLGMKVIAEGVEDREIWEALLGLGCDEAQGYYMTRPLIAPEMTKWLLESQWGFARANLRADSSEAVEEKHL